MITTYYDNLVCTGQARAEEQQGYKGIYSQFYIWLLSDTRSRELLRRVERCWHTPPPKTYLPNQLKQSNNSTLRNVLHTPILPNFRHQKITGLQAHILFIHTPSKQISRVKTHNTFVRNTINMSFFSSFRPICSRRDACLQKREARWTSAFLALQQSPSNLHHMRG